MSSIVNSTNTNNTEFRPGCKLILGIVLAVFTFWLFAQTLLNIGADIQKTLPIPDRTLNLAISLTSLFSGCIIVLAGGLADKFGCLKLTYTGLALSIAGSLCLVLASGAILFTIGRIVQGLSAACIMPATLSIIKEYYKGAKRQRAISLWSIGSWGGSGVASLVGGMISTYFGWRYIFGISILISIISIFLILGTPETKKESGSGKFDTLGMIFFLISLITLNVVITQSSGLNRTAFVSLIIICLASLILFAKIELGKKDRAFIDFALFKNRAYSGSVFSNFLLNAVAGTLIVVNSYVQTRGYDSFQTGMLTIGYLVSVLVMIIVGEKLMQKFGSKKPMYLSSIICGLGILFMALTFLPNIPYLVAVFVGYILYGTGLGMYATPSTDTAVANIPENKTGIGSGIYKMASSLGSAFGIAISASVVVSLKTSYGITYASTAAIFVNILFCVCSALIVLIMVPSKSKA